MKIEVLISCMHQKDASIIRKTNIQSDVLVINQCDEEKVEHFDFLNKKGEQCHARIFYTKERGLSKSRNMALKYATGDICLICDDDEILNDNYKDIIENSFREYYKEDIIIFCVQDLRKSYPSKTRKINKVSSLKIISGEIALRKESILNKNINFDIHMGAGTPNGSGEENKFLFDCLNNNIRIRFVPHIIGKHILSESSWFFGYSEKFMKDKGWASRRIMGRFWGYLYIIYFTIRKYPLYKNDCNLFNALKYLHIGFFKDRGIQ